MVHSPSATTPSATTTPSDWSSSPRRRGVDGRTRRGGDRPHRSRQPDAERARLRGVRPGPRAARDAQRPYGGFFDGVPTFVKDNVAVAGMPTMQGTDAWEPRPMRADGDFARVFLSTGLIPLGKTQMSEFGFSASAEHPRIGPVRNPWNPDYTAGASSSGSVRSSPREWCRSRTPTTAAGRSEFPRPCNGLVGLKPTRGRLPLDEQAARCRCISSPTAC